MSSFIVGNISGGASEFVNNAASNGSDNASGVYLDLGTATQDPNGRFDPETDIALRGFWPGLGTAPANDFGTVLINTSGLEGRRAQIVGFDDSAVFHVALDAFRMNWDWEESIIKNGGFDAGVPTPQSHSDALAWFAENGTELTPDRHPSGKIPNWTVTKKAGGTADAFFFDASARRDHMTGRTYGGTGGGDRSSVGVEIRSDVFTIAAIPATDGNDSRITESETQRLLKRLLVSADLSCKQASKVSYLIGTSSRHAPKKTTYRPKKFDRKLSDFFGSRNGGKGGQVLVALGGVFVEKVGEKREDANACSLHALFIENLV
jgi:hypothetical protein